MTAQDTSGEKEEVKQPSVPVPLADFFESTPPSQIIRIPDVAERKFSRNWGMQVDLMRTPDIQLHCTSESCNGPRFFRYLGDEPTRLTDKWQYFYLKYQCWNCQQMDKTFSLAAKIVAESKPSGHGYKFG
jgi:hypothetical protein